MQKDNNKNIAKSYTVIKDYKIVFLSHLQWFQNSFKGMSLYSYVLIILTDWLFIYKQQWLVFIKNMRYVTELLLRFILNQICYKNISY